jgi:hypothetical protein
MIRTQIPKNRLSATRFADEEPAKCDICKRQTSDFLMVAIELSARRIIIADICPICERDLTIRSPKPRGESK